MGRVVDNFGERVKYFHNQQKLRQEKLAELSELHPSYIGQIERGEKTCSIETAVKISKGLQIPIERLMGKITPLQEDTDIPNQVYNKLLKMSDKDQKSISNIIDQIIEYKTDK